MGTYAADTSVDSAKSRAEIERTLERYGAEQFGYATTPGKAMVEFFMVNRRVRFVIGLPDKNEKRFTHTDTGKLRGNPETVRAAYEQAIRQKWRALALVVKAKLEAVESGISEFEQEFGMNIVLPDGRTVYDHTQPSIAQAYATGKVPSMLQIEG